MKLVNNLNLENLHKLISEAILYKYFSYTS